MMATTQQAPRQKRRWTHLAAAGVALCPTLFGLAGCGVASADHEAEVRFVNVSTDSPAMDLYLNGGGAAYGIGFGTVTSYVSVVPGESRVSLLRTNTGQTLITASRPLAGAQHYTAVAGNTLGSLDETVYQDSAGAAPAGYVAVRVLNEDSNAGPLDVSVSPVGAGWSNPVLLARGLPYLGGSAYIDLAAKPVYNIAVTQQGTQPAAASVLHGTLLRGSSGAVRTVVLAGTPGRGEKGLTGFVLDDSDLP